MKPGRYIKIGHLLIPIEEPSAPDPYRPTYWVGSEGRARRRAICRDHGLADRMSNFAKIWAILQRS